MRRLLPKKPCHLLFCLWNNIDNEHISFSFQFFPVWNKHWYPSLRLKSPLLWKDDSEIRRTIERSTKIHAHKKGECSRRKRRMKSNGSECEIRYEFGTLCFATFFFRAVIPCKQLVLLLYLILIFIVYCKKQKQTEREPERGKKGINGIEKN